MVGLRRRRLPGGRADRAASSASGQARLAPRRHRLGVPGLLDRLQRLDRPPRTESSTASSRARTPRSTATGCATHGRFLAEALNHATTSAPDTGATAAFEPRRLGARRSRPRRARLCTQLGPSRRRVGLDLSQRGAVPGSRALRRPPAAARWWSRCTPASAPRIKNGRGEWLASHATPTPTRTGARLLGLTRSTRPDSRRSCRRPHGPVVVLDARAHPWLASDEAASSLLRVSATVAVRPRPNPLDPQPPGWLLPTASMACRPRARSPRRPAGAAFARRSLRPAGDAGRCGRCWPCWPVELGARSLDAEAPAEELFEASQRRSRLRRDDLRRLGVERRDSGPARSVPHVG